MDIYIINDSGTAEVFKTVQPTDESYHLRELQGSDECEIKLELAEYVDFPLGCYIEWKGNKYTLCTPAQIEKNGTRQLSYTLTFSGALKSLSKYRMRHIVSSVLQDSKLDFSITAYPQEILQMIVDNINYRESGWSVGTCEPTSMVTQTYSMTTIEDALSSLAEECDTEYEIDGKTIHLRKVEYNKSNPITLQYGKGGGFIPGVARQNSSESNPMEILFVQGGEKNIDSSKYGCTTLLMPDNSGMVTYYDGEHYKIVNEDGTATADDGFNEDNARAYKVSTDRMSIERADAAKSSYSEGAMTDTDIYPKRVGTITAVINQDDDPTKVLFQDSNIPETLNYKELTAAGQSLNVVFSTGMLTGKTFEVNYNHTKRQFAMVGATIDDVAMPDETWRPAVGDEFVILNMVMPTDYLYNHTLHTGAEYDLLKAAVKYMYENEDDKYTFEGTLDTIWSKANWEAVGGKIKVGGYVKFIDPQFEAAGVLLRITSVKETINNPYAPTIEISNSANGSSVASKIANLETTTPVAIDAARRAAVNFANRGFAAVKETTDMLAEQFTSGYTESISPLSVHTMQTIVGDESVQFAFYGTSDCSKEVSPSVTYDANTLTLTIEYYTTDTEAYYIQHKTLGVTTMSTADYSGNELKKWAIYRYTSGDLDEDTAYYVYVKASTDTTQAATFEVTSSAKQMEEETGYYYLLFGFLNKPTTAGGARSFAQMYGYSEILPGRITTDKVVSQDGKTGFDLVNGRIFGNIEFNADTDNTAVINSIINANSTVTSAASNASSALNTATTAASDASTAKSTATTASTTANNALTTANTANTTATTANATLANFQVGGRNLLKNSAKTYTLNYTSSTNTSIEIPLVDAAKNMTFSDAYTFAWLSFYVDGWTETYVPNFNGWNFGTYTANTSGFEWWGWSSSDVSSGYIQINSTTRRYWFKIKSNGFKLLRCCLYSNNTKGTPDSGIPKVYNVMLSFGAALTDYAPAQEDVDSSISTAQSTATTASANASTALSTANEVAANAQGRNLLRGTQDMAIGAGYWETANFRRWAGSGTMQTLTQTEIATFTGESVPYDVKTSGMLLTPVIDSSTSTYHKEEAFQQDCRNQSGLFKAGETLTFSAYVWANQAMLLRYIHNANVSSDYQIVNYQLAKGWNKVSITYTATTPAQILMYYSYKNALTTQPYMIWANLKLERGSTATMWTEAPEDTDARIAETDYLRESLEEAAASTTDLTGGLVLSKYIGVKNASGTVVAGMSGTSAAVNNTLPMIWAGASANTDAAMKKADFRVFRDGSAVMNNAKILGGSGTNGMVINNGVIKLGTIGTDDISESDTKMRISPTVGMTDIASIINATSTADVSSTITLTSETVAASQKTTASGANAIFDEQLITGSKTLWTTTISTSVKQGTLYFSFNEANLTAKFTGYAEVIAGSGKTGTVFYTCDYSVWIENGTNKVTLIKGTALADSKSGVNPKTTATESAAASSLVSIPFAPGDTISIKGQVYYEAGGSYTSNTSTASVSATLTGSASLVLTCSSVKVSSAIPVYNNHYFGNGFMLSSANTKYLAASSQAGDTAGTVLQCRSSSALFKFTSNGLLQSLNGSTFYRVNPLIWVAKVSTSDAKTATPTVIYNPMGKSISCTRQDTGRIRVTHNLYHTNYTISAHGCGTNAGTGATGGNRYVYMFEKTSTYFDVVMNLDHVNYDGICEILLYDLSSF